MDCSRRTERQCKEYIDYWMNYEIIQENKKLELEKTKENNQKIKDNRVKEKLHSFDDNNELKSIILELLEDKDKTNPKISDWIVGQVMKQYKNKYDPTIIKYLTIELCK